MKLNKDTNTLNQVATLVSEAFKKEKDLKQNNNFMTRYNHSDGYGIVNDHNLESYIMVNQFDCRVFRERTKMAGIGYVSSSKLARGKGNISKLMKEIFEDLHNQNIPFANLAPFSETFYRQYGFENTIYQKKYSFSSKALKDIFEPQDGEIRVGKWQDLIIQNGAAQLYEVPMHTTNERNTINRPFWWWNRLDDYYPDRKLAVYFGRVGLPEAYMFFTVNQTHFKIDEMFANDVQGIKGLLGFMAEKSQPNMDYSIITPEESRLENMFPEQRLLSINTYPYMMSRIINISQIFSAIKLVENGSFVIRVSEDELCPWNIGNWKLTQTDNEIKVEKTDLKPSFEGSINAWTKIFLGNLSVEKAFKLGEIKGKKHSDFEVIKGTTSFYDYY
ncbi:GNAT family N-acetyltransferase [Lactobacillus hamsteri]|uniref:Acetyltransferase n=1 Tax=Lactobacillus hamsteri DSM 5661 = JCM 6256 TaxID=1423754 RepID=A0A0R1YDG9_9LACO|nr:GNAT family N-acetyltransferase [Lactobacillus hamsteri]KRM40535.1 hypothetical protein FC39_GL000559 [Lactobacillus hamsteri DSM 5661 = JCM 6256]